MQETGTNKKLKEIAKKWELVNYLKENPSQAGQEPKTTFASTVEAIIGAVWIDCDRNIAEVRRVLKHLQA